MPVALHAAAANPAVEHVEGGEQRGRAIALIIMGHGHQRCAAWLSFDRGGPRCPGQLGVVVLPDVVH
jgi:hypothetical protein